MDERKNFSTQLFFVYFIQLFLAFIPFSDTRLKLFAVIHTLKFKFWKIFVPKHRFQKVECISG